MACQTEAPQPYQAPVDVNIQALQQLDQSLASGDLSRAESQWAALQQRLPGDTRLQAYPRQLVEAYLAQGNRALQQGDLDQASRALSRARQLMPQAPALTTGLDQAIAQIRDDEKQRAERASQQLAAQAQAEAQAQAALVAQARQQRLAAERAAAERPDDTPPTPAVISPRLIDPAAASTTVALPMLDQQDADGLRSLLDGVAQDVVHYDCRVQLQVREAKDFPWVAALLTARIKKLDPQYRVRLRHSVNPAQAPFLSLHPTR